MSHKIHKNANARQQAYRDRKKAALIEARKAGYAAARDHGKPPTHGTSDKLCHSNVRKYFRGRPAFLTEIGLGWVYIARR